MLAAFISFCDQECACSVHSLTSKIHSRNVVHTDFMETAALMDRTVCPFKLFIFLQCWRGMNTSQHSLSKFFSSIRANSNLMEQVVA